MEKLFSFLSLIILATAAAATTPAPASANAEPKVYVHYLCQETRPSEPAGIVNVFIASGLDYPGATRGIRISSASGSRVFRISEAKQLDADRYLFHLANGGKLELDGERWRNKLVGKGAITLQLPGEPTEIFGDCDADTKEVGFTIGN